MNRASTRVSESLAGRIAILELSPLLTSELGSAASRDRHWLMGGFPDGGVLVARQFPHWQENYLAVRGESALVARTNNAGSDAQL